MIAVAASVEEGASLLVLFWVQYVVATPSKGKKKKQKKSFVKTLIYS